MKQFALSALIRDTAAVKHEAARAPVAITERSTPRFVLMAIEDYEKLTVRRADPRRTYKVRDMPVEDAELFLPALERQILGDRDS